MKHNVGTTERVITGVAAAGLAALAFKKSSVAGKVAAGVASGALAARSITGYCPVKQAVEETGSGLHVERQVIVNAPIEQVYEFWRNVENFPKFMQNLKSVTKMSDTNSHWISYGPLNTEYEWDAETTRDEPNEVIAWRSVSGDVENNGTVRFTRVGPKTRVRIRIDYSPPAGAVGDAVARLFGDDPESQLEEYLDKLKQILDHNPSTEQIRKAAYPEASPVGG